MSPVPSEPIPILIGGHATPALRRAARCDGWVHGGGDPADLPGLLAKLRQLRTEEGTADRPFEVHVISLDAFYRRRRPPAGGGRGHRCDRGLPLAL